MAPSAAAIAVGQTQQFTATARDPRGNVIRGLDFQWTSDTPSSATVNASGMATALKQGTAHITATLAGIAASATLTVTAANQVKADVFVATNGSDSWSGTLAAPNAAATDGPLASVARAQMLVRSLIRSQPNRPITVMLRGGTYYLPLSMTSPGAWNLTASDSGTAAMPVAWANYPGESPVISGGEPVGKGGLGLAWKNISGSLWQVQLPANTQPFGYLYYNGERRLRSRLQSSSSTSVGYYMRAGSCYSTQTGQAVAASQCNLGTYLRIQKEISPTDPQGAGCPNVTNSNDTTESKCLDRFGYNPADPVGAWVNLNPSGSICGGASNAYPVGDVEIMDINAWTVDLMRVSCVDTINHIVYFTASTKGNGGVYPYFGPTTGHRYIVENTRDAFTASQAAGETGIWFLDRSTFPWTLNYLANSGENPNADSVVIAQLQPPAGNPLGGMVFLATNLSYVTFLGITFEVDNYVPPPTGFNQDESQDDQLPEAVDCESCQHVTFDGVTIRHTSTTGLVIASVSGNSGQPAANDLVQNSAFYDTGDAGIRVGHEFSGSDRAANVVQFLTIQNNIIQGFGRVFPDARGIGLSNGHDILYQYNDVNDGYHAGISVCYNGCGSHTVNAFNVVTQYNHIWNLIQGTSSDGGSLYYSAGNAGGSGTGNKVLNNLVHDTTDASIIDSNVAGSGYGGEGLYFDAQTAGMDAENNVVYNVSAHAIWISEGPAPGQPPNTYRNNIFAYAREAMFNEGGPWPQGCGSDPTHQVDLTNNIFYFDRNDQSTPAFYVTNGCAYSCGANYNQFQSFQGNLYWRTDGKFATYPKGFHVVTSVPSDPAGCSNPSNPAKAWTFLTFSQWQGGTPPNGIPAAMDEDTAGTVTVNPHFGSTGQPSDYLLSTNLVPGFDYTKTNDTILHAGRNHPELSPMVPKMVPATLPTYTYTNF
jgi:hypothetical protein